MNHSLENSNNISMIDELISNISKLFLSSFTLASILTN